MSYEYDVPFVDFITSFGENDDADKFFDVNTELEKLSIKETPLSREKGCTEKSERHILQEVCENIQNIGSIQRQRRNLKILSTSIQPIKDVQNSERKLDGKLVLGNLKTQLSQGFSRPVSASRNKKHFQTVEEVNGELCIKNDEIKHAGVPRTIPSQRTRTVIQRRSFEERQKSQIKRREEKIKKVLEEEQKKRVFHANPIPNYLKLTQQKPTCSKKLTFAVKCTAEEKKPTSAVKKPCTAGLAATKPTSTVKKTYAAGLAATKSTSAVKKPYTAGLAATRSTSAVKNTYIAGLAATKSTSALKSSNISSQNSTTNTFRARPAYVIRKQPFLPKRTDRSVKPGSITLHSEERAKARKQFDEKLRQHYKELEDEARAKKEEQLRREKEEIAELRKKLVHKAQPVPLYKTTPVRANCNGTRPKNCKVMDKLGK